MKIGIVGLGLIGGSFALATSRRTNHIVYGYDPDEVTMVRARADEAIAGVLTEENLSDMDLVLLGVVPHIAIDFVKRNAHRLKGVVMDLCGIKRAVSDVIFPLSVEHGFRYVGGHPMAGREYGGYDNAAEEMFDRMSMILIGHDEVPEGISEYMKVLGFSDLVYSDDEKHDRIIAFTSQMAHVVSNNYCKSKTGPEHRGYSADSLRDLTRVAGLNPVMWTELFIGNKDYLLEELDRLMQDLGRMAEAIREEDKEALELMLAQGSRAKHVLYPRGVACEEYRS